MDDDAQWGQPELGSRAPGDGSSVGSAPPPPPPRGEDLFAPPESLQPQAWPVPGSANQPWESAPTRRRWPVALGIVAVVVVLVAGVAIGVRVLTGAVRDVVPSNLGLPSSTAGDYIGDLTVGQCYRLGASDRTADTVSDVTVVACTTPHDGQVFAITTPDLPDSATDSAIGDASDAACTTAQAALLPAVRAQSTISPSFYAPLTDDWSQGDHDVTCVIESDDAGGLTRSWLAS